MDAIFEKLGIDQGVHDYNIFSLIAQNVRVSNENMKCSFCQEMSYNFRVWRQPFTHTIVLYMYYSLILLNKYCLNLNAHFTFTKRVHRCTWKCVNTFRLTYMYTERQKTDDHKYTERKKKRILWISKRQIYIENIIFLKFSNLHPLIPWIKFLNKFL